MNRYNNIFKRIILLKNLIFLESVKKMPLLNLPVRSTVILLGEAKALLSPGSNLTSTELQKLGNITDIVAPSLFHCSGVPLAHSTFPKAKIWAPTGAKKTKAQISWTHELSKDPWPYQEQLICIPIKGIPKINEFVFVHNESKSLIITDLCFNLTDLNGLGAWIILNLFGTYRKFAMSKFFLKFAEDKLAFEQSLQEILNHDFENIVVSHGANVIGGGRKKLLLCFQERGFCAKHSF